MNAAFCLDGIVVRLRAHFWSRPKVLLDGLHLSLQPGQMGALLGSNGAGKTTSLRVLMGLLRPQAGRGHVFGAPIGCRTARRHVGFAPEQPALPLELTALEFVAWVARLRGHRAKQAQIHALQALERVGLVAVAGQRLRGFSKGMRQRVGLAQAIVGGPRLLVLDEPLSGLDPHARRDVHALLRAERARGAAVLFATHSLEEVVQDCDVAAILCEGRRVHVGAPSDLLRAASATSGAHPGSVRLRFAHLADGDAHALFDGASHILHRGDGWTLEVPTLQHANDLVAAVRARGGQVVQLSESLRPLERLLRPVSAAAQAPPQEDL